MNRLRRSVKRAVATPLAALLLSLSVAVPLLERADFAHTPVIESEHQPGTCPRPHDHTICTQVGSNHAAADGSVSEQPIETLLRFDASVYAEAVRDGRPPRSRSARAPPSV